MSEKLEPGDVDWLCDWMQPERLGWHNRERFKRILTALSAVPGRIDLEEAAADPHADRGVE